MLDKIVFVGDTNMIKAKDLTTDNISSDMLLNFNHHQIITENGKKKQQVGVGSKFGFA